jgi:pimeloyl-ACP methyl ester carboxylesterase
MNPILVLLPGMDGTGDLFAPLIDALGDTIACTVVRYPDEPLDYAGHEAIARAALPTNRPYVILGESFSGPIAVSIAGSAPPGLVGYILCASFVTCPRIILKVLRPFLGLGSAKDVPAAIADYLVMGRFATPELARRRMEALRRVSSSTLAARLRAMSEVDVRESVRRVSLPGLYLRATEDRMVPRSAGDEFAGIARNAKIVQIEAPHFLLQARPLQAALAISAFMRSLAESA